MTEWAWDRTIVCHTGDEVGVREALERTSPEPVRFRVLCRSVCNRGQAFVINDQKLDSFLDQEFPWKPEPVALYKEMCLSRLEAWALTPLLFKPRSIVDTSGF